MQTDFSLYDASQTLSLLQWTVHSASEEGGDDKWWMLFLVLCSSERFIVRVNRAGMILGVDQLHACATLFMVSPQFLFLYYLLLLKVCLILVFTASHTQACWGHIARSSRGRPATATSTCSPLSWFCAFPHLNFLSFMSDLQILQSSKKIL